MHDREDIVRLESVGKQWRIQERRIAVLSGVSLSIHAGQSVAIVGASGAGKSTLLHVMGLLTPFDSGRIYYFGERVDPYNRQHVQKTRTRIAYVFQDAKLLPKLNVLENVCLPLNHRGIWPRKQKAIAMREIERVGLIDRWRHNTAQLSGGEMMRVAIARALVMAPALLLVDEPTGSLDSRNGELIADLLFDTLSRNAALVLVTHNNALARRASRIVKMKDGALV